jgi:dephospho-CoA kinase
MKPFVLGLSGSIGMGKSTTAGFFRDAGLPVWDADAAVHRLYSKDGAAVEAIRSVCPEAIVDEEVSREALKDWIAKDPNAISKLNSVVHPLVGDDRAEFIHSAGENGALIVVVDVPLLFETGGDARVDATLVVTTDAEIQKARVLARPGMTKAHFERILSSQMPDAEKRKRADFVIETVSMDAVRDRVSEVIAEIRSRIA